MKVKINEDEGLKRDHGKLFQFEVFMKYDVDAQAYHELNNSFVVPVSDTVSYMDNNSHSHHQNP